LIEELINILLNFTTNLGYIGIYIYMSIVGTFIPLPSQAVLIPAGYLASKNEFNFLLVLLSATLGSTTGATINYFLANNTNSKIISIY
jgi:membrane protein DedA with SNARE-associated domain